MAEFCDITVCADERGADCGGAEVEVEDEEEDEEEEEDDAAEIEEEEDGDDKVEGDREEEVERWMAGVVAFGRGDRSEEYMWP